MATTTRTRRPMHMVPAPAGGRLEQQVDDYLAAVRARGGSPRTEEFYEAALTKKFLPFCAAEHITDLLQLDQRALNRLNTDLLGRVSEQTGRPLSKASVASYLRGIRQFLAWAKQEGLAAKELTVQGVKVPKKILDTLSRQEIADLEAAASAERDKLIIRILADAGVRLSELLGLTIDDVVEEGRARYIKVNGKGSRERLVPIKPAVHQRLRRYAERGRPQDSYTKKVFISLRRRPSGEYEALDPRAVQQMVRAVATKAGINRPVYPHMLRHSMITNALKVGANPVILAKVVGHADLSMITNVYAHLVPSDTHVEMMRILVEED